MNYTAETEQKRLQDEAASSAERDDVMTESSFNSPTSPHSPSLFKKMKFYQF